MEANGGFQIRQGFCSTVSLGHHHSVDCLRIGQLASLSLLQLNAEALVCGCDRQSTAIH